MLVAAFALGVVDSVADTALTQPLKRFGATATGLSAPTTRCHIALCDALRCAHLRSNPPLTLYKKVCMHVSLLTRSAGLARSARDAASVQAELSAIRGLPKQHDILFDAIYCAHGFYDQGAAAQYGFSYPSQLADYRARLHATTPLERVCEIGFNTGTSAANYLFSTPASVE